MRAIQALVLSILVMTSAIGGVTIVSEAASADAQHVATSSAVEADDTPTHTVDSGRPARFGQTVTVADVSYDAGNVTSPAVNVSDVSDVSVDFRGDRSFLEDDDDGDSFTDAVADVRSLTITLYKDGGAIAEVTTPSVTTGQRVSLSPGNVSNVSRIVIEATLAGQIYAEHGDVLDARFQFVEHGTGDTSGRYDTEGRTVIHSRGTGAITGEVYNGSSDSGLDGATVWAFSGDRAVRNQIGVDSGKTVASSENREWFVRVVDTRGTADPDDDTVVDSDEYVVVGTSGPPPDVIEAGEMAVKIERLDTTDRSVGSGFVVFDRDGDDDVQFSVIPLRAGEYRIEASENRAHASRYATTTTTGFTAVSTLGATVTGWLGPTGGDAVRVTENLTADAAAVRDEFTGADLYQETTDRDGAFVLDGLFGDGTDGEFYWVAAEKSGFDRRFGFDPGSYKVSGVSDGQAVDVDTPLVLNRERLHEETDTVGADPDGDGNPSTDVDGDGLHEDVDGDGAFTILDVALFLDAFDGPAGDPALFDFVDDGSVDVRDVAALLDQV